MSRAAVYLRISDDRAGDSAGVIRQRDDCLDYCARNGLSVAAIYEDNDISASAYTKKIRPGYREMLAAVKAGEIDCIVAWHIDRLYRRPRDLEDIVDMVEAMKGALTIRTIYGELDLSTADGRAMARVVVAMAAKASDDTSRRVRRKQRELAEKGKPKGGGKRPFGFEPDQKTLRESEAELIRQAAGKILAGASLRSIAAAWKDVPTVTGLPWRSNVIKRVLLSPRIAGLREHNGSVVGPAEWPGIISQEQHQELRAILGNPSRRTAPGTQVRRYLLPGIASCGVCGALLVARPRDDGTRAYVCAGGANFDGCGKIKVTADPLEAYVKEAVMSVLDNDALTNALKSRDRSSAQAKALADTITTENAKLDRMKGLLVDGDISQADYRRFRTEIEQHISEAQNALARLSGTSAAIDIPAGKAAASAWWDTAHLDRKRAILRLLIERVVVNPAIRGLNRFDDRRIQIHWHA